MKRTGLMRAWIITAATATLLTADCSSCRADDEPPVANRPRVPGTLQLNLRSRDKATGEATVQRAEWRACDTAIIICDMWDDHYCQSAAQRVSVMAPRMNEVITAARNHGVMIIHAPSGCMDQYEPSPHRLRMQQARHSTPPVEIAGWCYLDPETEGELPIVDSRSPCDDPVVGEAVKVFTKQHPDLDIIGYDGVSDSGIEIYNFCAQEGITNIVLMGVHTNMCVLGRPFGIRQQVRLKMNVALCRDLTDAMYDPREPPYVSHTRGTELVIEHIEKHWCPSITGAELMTVIAGSNDPEPAKAE